MDFKGKNGEPLVSTSYDPEKWRLAAEAADKAVEVCEQGGFALCKGTIREGNGIIKYDDGHRTDILFDVF